MKDYVRERGVRSREMFVPLVHAPGHAQVDFGEARAVIGGVARKLHFFAFDLPHSDGCFVKAYPAETSEAFCDGHVAAFAFFAGVPRSVLYDNTRLSPAGIAEQNRYLLQRQQEFRLAADAVTAAWSERGEVEAVALFGSVAVALWKEVPRFRTYRRAGIALRHECKDLDLALWLSSTSELGGLRKAKPRALAEMYKETGIGVASHQVDVFVLAPGTDSYLGAPSPRVGGASAARATSDEEGIRQLRPLLQPPLDGDDP